MFFTIRATREALYANNEISERGRKQSCLKLQQNKKLGVNLTKEAKDLYAENYKKTDEGNSKKWKDILCS